MASANNEIQMKRLNAFAESRVKPSIELWRKLMSEDSIFQIHAGQTLLETLSLLLLGIEIAFFPSDESTPFIQDIFNALGDQYHFYMSNFAENWPSEERARFSFAFHQMDRGYYEPFRSLVTPSLPLAFATTLLLLESFANDDPAFTYQASQNNMIRVEWDALKIKYTTFKWASDYNSDSPSVSDPPFWIAGFLNSYDHIEGQLSMFSDVSSPDMVELRRRVLGLQRWRFNINNKDVSSRFFEVSDSIAEILDLITPAGLNRVPKEEFRVKVKTVVQEFGGGLSLVAGA